MAGSDDFALRINDISRGHGLDAKGLRRGGGPTAVARPDVEGLCPATFLDMLAHDLDGVVNA